jgi:DNA-binding transcriptional ArsR family regulator
MPENLYGEEHESILLKLMGRTPELRLIDFFMDNPLNDYTRTEIREALSMTKRTLSEKLPTLEDLGLVRVTRKIGKAKLYQIDLENPTVKSLAEIERTLSLQIAQTAGETAETTITEEDRIAESDSLVSITQRRGDETS